MMNSAMDINKNTTPEAIQQEQQEIKNIQKRDTTTTMDNSEFLYPTFITIPIIIVLISILTLHISHWAKFILFAFLLVALIVYIMQFKKYNITKPLLKMSDNIKETLNIKDVNRKKSSYTFN